MRNKLRLTVQLLFTIVTNGYMYGFLNGKIYQGSLKYACVPGLNCYSCPGAIAFCPIGALRALLNQRDFQVPFAALGFFFVFGSVLGRFVCGWLCPFGLVRDLLHKISLFKKKKRLPGHRVLKYGKYVVLVLLVCVGSMFLFGGFAKVPAFYKYLCRSGTSPTGRQRSPEKPGRRPVPLEAGHPAWNCAALRKGLLLLLPVPVPLGGYLLAGSTASASYRFTGSRSGASPAEPVKGLSGSSFRTGDFSLPGVHSPREVRGYLPAKVPTFHRLSQV